MNDDHYHVRLQSVATSVAESGTLCVFGEVPDRTLDNLRRYGLDVLMSPQAVPTGATVVSFSHLSDFAPDELASFLHLVGDAGNLVVFERNYPRKLTIDEAAFASGFRIHPASYALVEYGDPVADGHWSILQKVRIPASAPEVASLPRAYRDLSRQSGLETDAFFARYMYASRFIRPGDCVMDIACGVGLGSSIIRHVSECAEVIGRDKLDGAIRKAVSEFSGDGLRFEVGKADHLGEIESESADTVVIFDALSYHTQPAAILADTSRLLRPSGRVVIGVPYQVPVAGCTVLDKQAVVSLVREHFRIEDVSMHCFEHRTITRVSPDGAEEPCDYVLVVGYKPAITPSAVERFEDTIYPYPDPTSNFLAFARDYANPLLMRMLFGFGVRISDAGERDQIAMNVMESAPKNSADFGAALCVTGYRVLESGTPDQLRTFVAEAWEYGSGAALSPHALRWSISLRFLAGLLEQRLGNRPGALKAFDAVIESPWLNFSPTIGTKAAEAAYRGGLIEFRRGDVEAARRYWLKGLRVGKSIMSADWGEIVGEESCPLPDSMRESIQALDIARKCGDCLRMTSKAEYRSSHVRWLAMIDDQSMSASKHLAVEQIAADSQTDAAKWQRATRRLKSSRALLALASMIRRLRR
ncbi:methyltransferase domain-containing protein [Rhizobium laguerreae]|nr:methyltransferase domain-containing protein [Rhizobium laguerreae]